MVRPNGRWGSPRWVASARSWRWHPGRTPRRSPGNVARRPVVLGVDELGEPPDLALDRLEPVAVQLEGVLVETLAGPLDGGLRTVTALLEPGPSTFEDAHAHLAVGLAEERQVDPERLVLPRRRAGVAEKFLQVL